MSIKYIHSFIHTWIYIHSFIHTWKFDDNMIFRGYFNESPGLVLVLWEWGYLYVRQWDYILRQTEKLCPPLLNLLRRLRLGGRLYSRLIEATTLIEATAHSRDIDTDTSSQCLWLLMGPLTSQAAFPNGPRSGPTGAQLGPTWNAAWDEPGWVWSVVMPETRTCLWHVSVSGMNQASINQLILMQETLTCHCLWHVSVSGFCAEFSQLPAEKRL